MFGALGIVFIMNRFDIRGDGILSEMKDIVVVHVDSKNKVASYELK